MKLIRWTRFSWDLSHLAAVYPAIESTYHLRDALPEEEDAVRKFIFSTFTLDTNWSFVVRSLAGQLEEALCGAFSPQRRSASPNPCLVLTHGTRIIGVSLISPQSDAINHLSTGPCVSLEYRNRGLATALLAESLQRLKALGLPVAYGLTQHNTPTADFVYPKFGSQQAPFHWPTPALAAG